MKYVFMLVISLFINACGFNGEQKLSTNDSNQNVNINFGFINQLVTLCQEKNLPSDYKTVELYNQAVANCVFNSFSIIPGANTLCKPGTDLSGYTPEQQQQIKATCLAVGGTNGI